MGQVIRPLAEGDVVEPAADEPGDDDEHDAVRDHGGIKSLPPRLAAPKNRIAVRIAMATNAP